MKSHISIFTFLLSAFATVGLTGAANAAFQYWAASTHPCTIADFDDEDLAFNRYNAKSGGYYHVFNDDLGVTDLAINESNDFDRITAQEPEDLRFKGWWTKKDGWTGGEAYVGEIDTLMTENRTITGLEIKTAGIWHERPTIVAKYVPVYTINTSVEPADSGTAVGGGKFEEGTQVSLVAKNATGYSFLHWRKSGTVVSSDLTYEFQAGTGCAGTYVAVFTGNVYKVTFDRQEGTGGSATAFVTYGEKASTSIIPPDRFGWTFGGYYTERNGEGTKVYNADGKPADVWKNAGDLTLYAFWTPNPYDLEIRPPEFGVREIQYRLGESEKWTKLTGATTVKVLCGTVCHVFVQEQGGYELSSPGSPWTNEDSLPGRWKAEMTGNGLVFAPTAKWTGYRLTVVPNGGVYRKSTQPYTWTERLRPGEAELNSIGIVTGGAAEFLGFFDGSGEPVYDVHGLNVKGTYWTDGYPNGVFRGTGDLTVYARWGLPKQKITVVANDPQMGSVRGGGSLEVGSTITLEATAKEGFAFLYWKKDGREVSTKNPYSFFASEETAGAYTAVFGKQNYTVRFYGNGGEGEMEDQSFTYNEAKALSSNKFKRENFTFAGWLTDPANATWTYRNGQIVSNLSTRADGIVRLFASWTPEGNPQTSTNYQDNAYSVAADCAMDRVIGAEKIAVALKLSADKVCTVSSNVTDIGGNGQFIQMLMPTSLYTPTVSAEITGPGKIEFSYKTEFQGEFSGKHGGFSIKTNDQEDVFLARKTTSDWEKRFFEFKSKEDVTISWVLNANENDYALLDDIRWIPDRPQPAPVEPTTIGVTLRLNDGTPAPDDIWDNLTLKVGAQATLPKPDGAGGFLGWSLTPGGETVSEPWTVPDKDVQFYAKWQYGVIAIPTAVSGLVYDGNLKTGVVEDVGFTLVDNTATNAGLYSAMATLGADCVWSDGTRTAKAIAWAIGKAAYDLSGISMTNATYVHDGKPHSLEITGTLPDGVTVSYKGNGQTEVGKYTVYANFEGDEENHLSIEEERMATLTILPQDAPPIDPDPPVSAPITNEVPAAVTGLVYDGTEQTGVPAGEGYSIVSNVATEAGAYVATAFPDEGHVWTGGIGGPVEIPWSIAKGTPDVSGITFPSAVYEYDGKPHSIGIVGKLPVDVEVVYSGDPTSRTEVGTNMVTASFVVTDTNNWNEITKTLTATLVITAKREPIDGSVANNYTATRADGSILTVSTSKGTTKGISFTAKLIVGKTTYSYTGGKMTPDGEVTVLPTCRTYGAPRFGALELRKDEMFGDLGAMDFRGNRLTQEDFDDPGSILWQGPEVSRVGVAFSAKVGVVDRCGPVKFSASKLPSGLKINTATGEITGVPTKEVKAEKAQSTPARVTVTSTVSSKLKTYMEFPIAVEALDTWAIGTFDGGGEDCQAKITVSKAGKISGQLLADGVKWTLSAKSFVTYAEGSYLAMLESKNGKAVHSCEIELTEGGLVGEDEVCGPFTAGRNSWKEDPWKQIAKRFTKANQPSYTPIGFEDESTITLKFASSGAVTAKGQFVKSYSSTGKPSYYSASCSTVLCPTEEPDGAGAFTGVVYVYYPPKAKTPIADGYIECVTIRWDGSQFKLVR